MRRDHLVSAAARLFAEGGTKAITHRSVSEAADVPLATVSYYFASIDQLVDVVFSETLATWRRAWEELRPEPGATLTPAEVGRLVADVLRQSSPEGYAHELRVYLAALHREQMVDEVHAMQHSAHDSVMAVLAATGLEDAWSIAPQIVMLLSGALVSITDPSTDHELTASMLEQMATRCVEDALERQRS